MLARASCVERPIKMKSASTCRNIGAQPASLKEKALRYVVGSHLPTIFPIYPQISFHQTLPRTIQEWTTLLLLGGTRCVYK